MTRLEITQERSAIGEKEGARRTLGALGLRRTGQSVSHDDTRVIRGMLRRVAHLVVVREKDDRARSGSGAGAPVSERQRASATSESTRRGGSPGEAGDERRSSK